MKPKAPKLIAVLTALALSAPAFAKDPHLDGITFDKDEPKLVRVVDASVKLAMEMKVEMADLGASEQQLREVQSTINGMERFRPFLATKQSGMEYAQLQRIGFISISLREISKAADELFASQRRKYCDQSYTNIDSTYSILVERTSYTAKASTTVSDAAKFCTVERQGPRF